MSSGAKGWGFPRWGEYGLDTDAATVRMCDYYGCSDKADHPAPKSTNGPEKWWFCQAHAGEYNRNWNYFEGLSDAEARTFADDEAREAAGFTQTGTYEWAGAEDGDGVSQIEREALAVLGLEPGASPDAIKTSFRHLAKAHHPDRNPGDVEAELQFQRIRAAYDVLSRRRPGQGV